MTERIRDAIQHIPPFDREVWIMVGMAVKDELGEDGFELWDDWSRGADTYNAGAARSSWRSFKGSGITILSLYEEAIRCGWDPREDENPPTEEELRKKREAREARRAQEEAEHAREQARAASKAAWILSKCKHEQHAYLQAKGWPDAFGSVWWPAEETNLLCIPMRVGSSVVGLQMIDRTGAKKYLKGARTSGAEFCISNDGHGAADWWVEGYATGLSLRDCLNALRMRYRIHVCFSAGNLKQMARTGYVVADNDESQTGEKVARATGLPYFLPPQGDLNDMHQAQGAFRTSQALRKWLVSLPVRSEAAM